MAQLPLMEPENAAGTVRTLLVGVSKKLGFVPGLLKAMANSPATLVGYMELRNALAAGVLPPSMREQIAIAVASSNACRGCLAAHTHFGRAAGLPEDEIAAARHWSSSDPRAAAALQLGRTLLSTGGPMQAGEIKAARAAGFNDAAIVEIAATVGMNMLTNLISNLAAVDPEFPMEE